MKRILLFIYLFLPLTFSYSQQNGPGWHLVHYFDIQNGYTQYGALSPIDENLVYVMLDNEKFYKSNDGGQSWTNTTTGISEDIYDMEFNDSNTGFAVGGTGSILKTTDGGATWTSISSGATDNLLSIDVVSLNNIWIVGKNGVVLHSTDSGNTWTLDNSLSTEHLNSIRFRNANEGYIAGNNGTLLHTTDGGNTWSSVAIGSTDDLFSLSLTENKTHLLAGTVTGEYYSSTVFQYDGTNWTSYGIPLIGYLGASSLYFHDDNQGYYAEMGFTMCNCSYLYVHNTIDSGQNWEQSYCGKDGDVSHNFSDIAFVNENVGFVLSGEILLKTTNGGLGWDSTWGCLGLPGENFAMEQFNNSTFSLYPNPSRKKIQIKSKTGFDSLSLEILNLNGERVHYKERFGQNQIDISSLESGIYFVKIIRDGKTLGTEKLVKK